MASERQADRWVCQAGSWFDVPLRPRRACHDGGFWLAVSSPRGAKIGDWATTLTRCTWALLAIAAYWQVNQLRDTMDK